jgi:hypothetical protein
MKNLFQNYFSGTLQCLELQVFPALPNCKLQIPGDPERAMAVYYCAACRPGYRNIF